MDIIHLSPSTEMWDDSLGSANFTPFYPFKLPEGFSVNKIAFRQENPEREYPRSSLKFFLSDNQRSLTIKEFHYDWAPPAYDCPCLWKNYITFPELDIPEPVPYLIGNSVLWSGFNYRNKRTASISRDRTWIELTVLEGNISDEELIQIASGLTPVNKDHAKEILSKTYAELSYGYPNTVKSVNVPISFWKMPVEESGIHFQRAYNPQEVPEEISNSLEMSLSSDYQLNSIVAYQKKEEILPSEDRIESIYEHVKIPGATIRLLKGPKNSSTITLPPLPDTTQKFRYEEWTKFNSPVFYAYRSEELGPHEVIWQAGNDNYLLLVKPAPWTNRKWFLEFFDKIYKIIH